MASGLGEDRSNDNMVTPRTNYHSVSGSEGAPPTNENPSRTQARHESVGQSSVEPLEDPHTSSWRYGRKAQAARRQHEGYWDEMSGLSEDEQIRRLIYDHNRIGQPPPPLVAYLKQNHFVQHSRLEGENLWRLSRAERSRAWRMQQLSVLLRMRVRILSTGSVGCRPSWTARRCRTATCRGKRHWNSSAVCLTPGSSNSDNMSSIWVNRFHPAPLPGAPSPCTNGVQQRRNASSKEGSPSRSSTPTWAEASP